LKADASDLLTKGTKSVFKKVDVKDTTTGLTNKEYDTDKIYKAVKQFAEDYNSLLTTASKTTNASILQKNSAMVKNVSAYEKELNALGITIGSDNKLSVDEDTFKAANMSDAKDLFNGSSSLGSSVYQSASEIENLASSAASSDSLYNSDAVYASSLTGSLYNSYT
jgi:flagellar capping protein FliD